ncbi:MAG TPA: proton-conducting transporter membrane subunit, partial [Burkholderiaceae bacterium]|nr:proton-conducting transporter membrane subunit [Burkholderiaceae bacterium]
RNMGGLRKYMPITWITSLVGSLALIATPFFSGFYSKDSIIEAAHASHLPGAGIALFSVTAGVFITAFYSFRLYFLVFHGPERFRAKPFPPEGEEASDGHDAHGDAAAHDAHGHGAHAHDAHDHDDRHGHTPHETPWVIWFPLVALAIPSVVIGALTIQPLLFGKFFDGAIAVNAEAHPAMEELAKDFPGWFAMGAHAFVTLPFWLSFAGVALSYWMYILRPDVPARVARVLSPVMTILENKYYFDWFNENVLAAGSRLLGRGLWKGGDVGVIDGIVDGSARAVGGFAGIVRLVQTGYLYFYALVMVLGVFALLTWQLWPYLTTIAQH